MVVDTSALIAITYLEPDHDRFEQAVARDPTRLISAASAIEAIIVVARRAGPEAAPGALSLLDDVMASLGLAVEPVTPTQVGLARQAYLRYGRVMHPAGLNYGDCFSYALAKESGEPLLFKGADFGRTDIAPCLEPDADRA